MHKTVVQVLDKAQRLLLHLILGLIWTELPPKSLLKEKVLIHLQTHLELLIWNGKRIRDPQLTRLAMPPQLSALHCVYATARDTGNS